jgi:hypothetical protein
MGSGCLCQQAAGHGGRKHGTEAASQRRNHMKWRKAAGRLGSHLIPMQPRGQHTAQV